jgi:hypothetical protein
LFGIYSLISPVIGRYYNKRGSNNNSNETHHGFDI